MPSANANTTLSLRVPEIGVGVEPPSPPALDSQQALMPFLFPHWSKDPKEVRQDATWVTGKGQGSQCQGPVTGDTVPGLIQRASEVRTDG